MLTGCARFINLNIEKNFLAAKKVDVYLLIYLCLVSYQGLHGRLPEEIIYWLSEQSYGICRATSKA